MGMSGFSLFPTPNRAEEVDIPEDIKSVLDNKCYGCHNSESQGEKAKKKLMLDKLDELSKVKMVATLGGIEDVVKEGSMPPEKFLEQKPEKKLTEEEQQLLAEWAVKASEEMMN
jgi:hypothetical protein